MNRIANSCVGQTVIIFIVSFKCEQWHKSSENNKEFKTKHIFVLT